MIRICLHVRTYSYNYVTYPGSGRLKWVDVRYGEEVGHITTLTTTPTCTQVACMCMI